MLWAPAYCDLFLLYAYPVRFMLTMQIRRALLGRLSDTAYNAVQSFHSDSAVSFALFLHHLPDMRAQLSAEVLLQAMQVRARNDPWGTPVHCIMFQR